MLIQFAVGSYVCLMISVDQFLCFSPRVFRSFAITNSVQVCIHVYIYGQTYRNIHDHIKYTLILCVLSYSIVYQSIPCWLWCAVWKTLFSHYQQHRLNGYRMWPLLPENPTWMHIIPLLAEVSVRYHACLICRILHNFCQLTAFFLVSFSLICKCSLLSCKLSWICFGGCWWVILWMERRTEGNYWLSVLTQAPFRLNSLVRRHQ